MFSILGGRLPTSEVLWKDNGQERRSVKAVSVESALLKCYGIGHWVEAPVWGPPHLAGGQWIRLRPCAGTCFRCVALGKDSARLRMQRLHGRPMNGGGLAKITW